MGSLSDQYRAQEEEKARISGGPLITVRRVIVFVVAAVGAVGLLYLLWLLLPPSEETSYKSDRSKISGAVLAFRAGLPPDFPPTVTPDGVSRQSDSFKGQLPIYARVHFGTEFALEEAAVGSEAITTLGVERSNPTGGTGQSGTPSWEDADGTGSRNPTIEKLFYHGADPSPRADHWNTATVVFQGVAYVVDSRDWFIDMDLLVELGYLKRLPVSTSPDNSATGSGGYSWYVDENGEVESLVYSDPTTDSVGYHEGPVTNRQKIFKLFKSIK